MLLRCTETQDKFPHLIEYKVFSTVFNDPQHLTFFIDEDKISIYLFTRLNKQIFLLRLQAFGHKLQISHLKQPLTLHLINDRSAVMHFLYFSVINVLCPVSFDSYLL